MNMVKPFINQLPQRGMPNGRGGQSQISLYFISKHINVSFFKKPNNSKSMSAFILKHELSTNKNENVCAQFQTF